MTPTEMKAKGYSFELSNTPTGLSIRVYQNGEYVAALSRLGAGFGFDWHSQDQWHLRSHDILELIKAQ